MPVQPNTDNDSIAIKLQLAQMAYDIFNISLSRYEDTEKVVFSELSTAYRQAWVEAIWAAVEVGKTKTITVDLSVKDQKSDVGYIIYMSCKDIKKEHQNLFTYSKFPDSVKNMYRCLCKKIHEKVECDIEEGEC